MSKLLEVQDLQVNFETDDGVVTAVDGVSFHIDEGELVGVVGESGCGKSVSALSILQLIPKPPGKIVGGKVLYRGEDLLAKPESYMRKIRGNEISMIFQEPMTSLNPVHTSGAQIAEALRIHQKMNKGQAMAKAVEMLRLVNMPLPERRANEYPHKLSGGMRQRVMIAMALACNPKLLIADEPTTALDVTIQAQILKLIGQLRKDLSMSVMLITHDLAVIAEVADRVVVMYAGKVVEQARVKDLFREPLHPYTVGLLHSIPRLDVTTKRLNTIEGTVPLPHQMPKGCRFSPRCVHAMPICDSEHPSLDTVPGSASRQVACWLYRGDKGE